MRSSHKMMMDYCTYCPKMCRFSCPVSEVTKDETHTPWGKMQIAKWLIEAKISYSKENALPLYQCTNCLHCQNYCEHFNDVPEALRLVRKEAVENYVAPDTVYRVKKNFSKSNNPYGHELFSSDMVANLKRFFNKKADILFFPSCHTLKFAPKRILTYFELFEKLAISNITLIHEVVPCCGDPMRALGFEDDFKEIAEIQFHSLNVFKTVVTDGPECCVSFKTHYKDNKFNLKDRPVHLLEFLGTFLKHSNYKTTPRVRGRVAYHDPPFLARCLNQDELPRKMISNLTGFPPVELSMNRKDTFSSGTEGSYDDVFPEISDEIAMRVVREVSGRRIKKLITACAKSETKFRSLSKDFEVQDIYEFMNDNIIKV